MENISDIDSSLCDSQASLQDRAAIDVVSRAALSFLVTFAAVVAVFLLQGYHPYADDAAIYVAGIKHLLHPDLYTSLDTPFLEAQGTFSIFEKLVALLVRISGTKLEWVLLLVQAAATAATLQGARRFADELFSSRRAGWMAFALIAAAFTLPIAGTSLSVMDPYVTARSMTTPLALFALAAMCRWSWNEAALLTVCSIAFHPLMGGMLALFEVIFFCYAQPRWRWKLLLAGGGVSFGLFSAATILAFLRPDSVTYRGIVWQRTYLFLETWAWYEYFGIVMPLLLCLWVWMSVPPSRLRDLAATVVLSGSFIAFVCLVFVHPSGSMFLARIQLLRIFSVIYLAGIVMMAGWLADVYENRTKVAVLFPILMAIGTSAAQFAAYDGRLHVELPTRPDPGAWHQAFLWIGGHTAPNALFGADPDLMELPLEGHEGFRAATDRGILGNNKDGGVVVLSPVLTERWVAQYKAQRNLASEPDSERVTHLAPFHVSWVLLPPAARTSFSCPFQNSVLKVCSLPVLPAGDLSLNKRPNFLSRPPI